jgi:hypothetical protein
MNTDKIKPLCAAITKHEDWDSLVAYLSLAAAPSEGFDTLRNAIFQIERLGEQTEAEFKKQRTKKPNQHETEVIDPDLDEV